MKIKILTAALFCSLSFACKKNDYIKPAQEEYVIPGDQFFPEGIAYDPASGIFYTGSTLGGDIVSVNVKTGATNLFASGAKQGRGFCTGMKLDAKGRLWVCGGPEGKVFVLDKNGVLIKSWDLATQYNAGFVNDCVIANGYIYFTDSRVQSIYRTDVNADAPGEMEQWLTFTNDEIPYTASTNANGIEKTWDGNYLIVVVSSSGKLYRINRETKQIVEIMLNEFVNSGDGLWLDGKTLYVSRNATGKVFPVRLYNDYSSGTVGTGFGENLLFNTTIAKAGKYLLVVNGQLNRRPPAEPGPSLPFTVSRVLIP